MKKYLLLVALIAVSLACQVTLTNATPTPGRPPYPTMLPTSTIPTSIPTAKPTIVPTPTNVPSDIVVPDPNSTNFSMTWIVTNTFDVGSLDDSEPHELTITRSKTTTGSRGWFVTKVFSDGSGAGVYNSLITFPHRGEENVVVTLAEFEFMVYRMRILRNGWLAFMAVDDDNIMREEVYRVPPINVTILD